ncbi:DUF6489 family protein [Radicibacter daui]|uniref:DUF6489 family protein n=1 Tax=Radicibacter daui TaxID=3064829 RepID=UPI004046C2AD
MKIKFDIDCTPEELRTFFGLPDVQPMQQALMERVQEQLLANIKSMDPEAMMKAWLPMGAQGLEQLQKMFWQNMTGGSGKSGS